MDVFVSGEVILQPDVLEFDQERYDLCRNYLLMRGEELVGDGLHITRSRKVAAGERVVRRNMGLVEDLVSLDDDEARATLCVPVDIDAERPESVYKTLDVIEHNALRSGFPVAVLIWFNSGYESKEDYEKKHLEVTSNYEVIKENIKRMGLVSSSVRSGLQMIPSKFRTMSQVRASYMDVLVGEFMSNELDIDQPVVWLDVDTTFIAPLAIAKISEEISTRRAIFSHANLQYSADFTEQAPLEELDLVAKAFVISEIARRGANRTPGEQRRNPASFGYVEEPGLGFLLRTYIISGGIQVAGGWNESGSLIFRTGTRNGQDEKVDIKSVGKWVFGENIDGLEFLSEIPQARVGVSGRRMYETARALGIDDLLLGVPQPYITPQRRAQLEASGSSVGAVDESTLRKLREENGYILFPDGSDSSVRYTDTINRSRRVVTQLIDRLLV